MGSGKLILLAIKKYGIDNFTKEILYVFNTEDEMNSKEKELVVISEQSYNLCEGGTGGFGYINKNKLGKYGFEHINKFKFNLKGTKKRVFLWNSNQEYREEYSKKLSIAAKKRKPTFLNKTHTTEARIKISTSNKGKIPWNKGIPRTEEDKQKIRDAMKKINHLDEVGSINET